MVLPPAAMGPVVALIGLELAGTAASNAGLKDEVIDSKNVIVFLVTFTDGSTWIGCIPQVPCRDPDPDCDHCRICCCVALRNCRFLRSCCSTAFFTPEFFNTKVQMGGDRDHSSGTSGHCIGAYRTSDRNK